MGIEKNKKKIFKRSFLIIFCLILVSLATWIIKNSNYSKPPKIQNFILLSIDDLRADRVGCYGNDRDVSPNMDKLAKEGAQFLNAFVSWPSTPQSHSSMLTSLYPLVFEIPLDPKIPTVTTILSKVGYKTAAFTGSGWMSEKFGILNGFAEYDDNVRGLKPLRNKTLKWLKKNHEKKFFLFLHTYYVHQPFKGPHEYFKKFAYPNYSGPIKNSSISTRDFIRAATLGRIKVSSADIQRLLDIYDSQIIPMDNFISQIVQTLQRLNLTDNTMLIITSDHGEQFYEYKRFGHTSRTNPFADISIKVPLIIYAPSLPKIGKVQKTVETIDIPPTILEAAGIDIPETFQGQSFFPILCGNPRSFKEKKEVFCLHTLYIGIRTEKFKLLVGYDPKNTKLYDLINDPAETTNVIDQFSPEIVESLIKKIENIQTESEILRRKLGIYKIELDDDLLIKPPSFDEYSTVLASFQNNKFIYKKSNSQMNAKFKADQYHLSEGKYGKGLVLTPDLDIIFPLESPVLYRAGSIEFWLKLIKRDSKYQKFLKIDLEGSNSITSINTAILWDQGDESEKRMSVEFEKNNNQGVQSDTYFFTKYRWDGWHHFHIAWEPGEFIVLIDDELVTQKNFFPENFFRQKITKHIKISGKNCLLDEFRISGDPRIYRRMPRRKVKMNPKLIERLKSLGYLK